MKWTLEEENLLKLWLSQGWKHKEIANELERPLNSIRSKALRIKAYSKNNVLKTTEQYIKDLPNNIILLEEYKGDNVKILHKHIICGTEWYVLPHNIVQGHGCPKCANNIKLTTEEYRKRIPKGIILLEDYIDSKTAILHKHEICGNTWKALPNNIKRGHICPECNKGSFKNNVESYIYLIYFTEYDLYKVGITNKLKERLKHFGQIPELIFYLNLKTGKEAKEMEKLWLYNLKSNLINTGLLISGNTETFRI